MNTLKNVVKKAIAVSSGAFMIGATTAGALALDLAEYPAPFIKNGQFDGMIVVGEKAASSDIIGAIDIAASLQAAATTPVTTAGSTKTVLTGDVKQIGESSDMLELGEVFGDVTQTLSDDDLEMLKGGNVRTQEGDTDFTQTIDLDGTNGVVLLDENHDDMTGVYMYYPENGDVFTYELVFTSGFDSEVDTGVAEDFEDESIFMLGDWYSISRATIANPGANADMTLELLAGQVTDTLTVGETKTYEIEGKEYEVTVLAVGNGGTAVKLLVNGEATNSMEDGDTETLSDGTEIGIRDVIETTAYRESDPGSLVEFYLGADKVEITDTDIDSAGGGSVDINDESINEVTVEIDGVASATDATINSITWTMELDAARRSDVFLEAGEGIRGAIDEPRAMLGNWDIVYQGLSEPTTAEINFNANGDDAYDFEFQNRRGDAYNIPYVFVLANGTTALGEEGQALVLDETDVALDDSFIVTTAGADEKADTYVLRFSDVDEDDQVITLEDVSTGSEIEANYVGDAPGTGNFIVGGKRFDFEYTEATNLLVVDQDQDATVGSLAVGNGVVVVTRYGGMLGGLEGAAGLNAGDDWNVTLTTVEDNLDNALGHDLVTQFTFDVTVGDELDVSMAASSGLANEFWYQTVSDEDRAVGLDKYGAWYEITEDTDQADDLAITYPSEQVEVLVFVVGGETSTSTSTTGGAGARVNPVGVGAAVLDRDVKYDQDNMIVVGGPCANTMAAQLLENPTDCAEGFTAGEAMIKLFDTGNNVALLVAGYEAADTVAASRVIAESADYDLEGMSVEVTTANLKDIRVTQG